MKSIVAAVAAALALVAPANAVSVAGGIGVSNCGNVRAAYDNGNPALQSDIVLAVGQWAYGYMTGRNAENPRNAWKDLSALTIDETAGLVLVQCGRHPSLMLGEVVDVIYDALPYAVGSS